MYVCLDLLPGLDLSTTTLSQVKNNRFETPLELGHAEPCTLFREYGEKFTAEKIHHSFFDVSHVSHSTIKLRRKNRHTIS